jgi:hypothetical protein
VSLRPVWNPPAYFRAVLNQRVCFCLMCQLARFGHCLLLTGTAKADLVA